MLSDQYIPAVQEATIPVLTKKKFFLINVYEHSIKKVLPDFH